MRIGWRNRRIASVYGGVCSDLLQGWDNFENQMLLYLDKKAMCNVVVDYSYVRIFPFSIMGKGTV